MVKYIKIEDRQNILTSVDDDMYAYLSNWEWKVSKDNYVYRTCTKEDGDQLGTRILLHRVVNNTPDGFITDHIDRNKLNNVKSNLRTCNHSQNGANKEPFENKTSKYKGVTFVPDTNKWRARVEGSFQIGYFVCEKAAAQAYNEKAIEVYGEFAYLNRVDNHDDCKLCNTVKKRKYIGVYEVKDKFRVIVVCNKKKYHVGYFDSEEEAVNAYNEKAIELKGDNATLNIL